MDFAFTDTQRAVIEAIEAAVERQGDRLAGATTKFVLNEDFRKELREQGYWDVLRAEGLELLGGFLLVEGLARSPFCMELTGSAMVWPALGLGEAPATVALVQEPISRAVRFAAPGTTAVVLAKDHVRIAQLTADMLRPIESHFAYPLAWVDGDALGAGQRVDVDAEEIRLLWSIGTVGEITGAAQAALDLTVQHVKDRTLFGKPLGSLQVVQHRLSECAVAISGAQKLAHRAALRPTAANAALAIAHAQQAAVLVSQECQQFHGAIGLTLEHPIHHWTYRLKYLATELGGIPANLDHAASSLWPKDAEIRDPLAEVDCAWI